MKTGRGLHSYMTLLLGLLNAFFLYDCFVQASVMLFAFIHTYIIDVSCTV